MAVVSAVPAGQHPTMHGAVQCADQQGGLQAGYSAAADVSGRAPSRNCSSRCGKEMLAASQALEFERAARLRDEIKMLETLDQRGELDTHAQPEVFYIDPKKGPGRLEEESSAWSLSLERSKGSTSLTWAAVRRWPALFNSLTDCPSNRVTAGTRSERSEAWTTSGASTRWSPVATRRLHEQGEVFPDLLLIDGGKGQLNGGLGGLPRPGPESTGDSSRWPSARRSLYRPGVSEPLRLSRNAFALRLLQYVRDEAHRFAQHYHHILRRKATFGE